MNKQEILSLLDERGVSYELTEHKAVYNMAELAEVVLPTRKPTPKTSSSATIKSAAITLSP